MAEAAVVAVADHHLLQGQPHHLHLVQDQLQVEPQADHIQCPLHLVYLLTNLAREVPPLITLTIPTTRMFTCQPFTTITIQHLLGQVHP